MSGVKLFESNVSPESHPREHTFTTEILKLIKVENVSSSTKCFKSISKVINLTITHYESY